MRFKFCLSILIFIVNVHVFAQESIRINETVRVCSVNTDEKIIPDFSSDHCQSVSLYQIDPQNKALWIKGKITVPALHLKHTHPLGLYVYGKMSSEVYFNGVSIGNNGTPDIDPKREFVGVMDAVFYVPRSLLKLGENEVVIYASSHHGILELGSPVHHIGLAEYAKPGTLAGKKLLLPFIVLGALLLGTLYLSTMALKSEYKLSKLLVALMLLTSCLQMLAEFSRSLISYVYPIQDVRLLVVVFFSLLFGVSFLLFSIHQFVANVKHRKVCAVLGVVLTLIAIYYIPSFDGKASFATLLPVAISMLLSVYWYINEKTSNALWYMVAYGAFLAINGGVFYIYHEVQFYYLSFLLLLFIAVKEALSFISEKRLRQQEAEQRLKLQLKLEQLSETEKPSVLTVNSSGKTLRLAVSDVVFCKASGDYVELYLATGKHVLLSSTLKSIESQLPTLFMKVHRSYIVNLNAVKALISGTKGTGGTLQMLNDMNVPVSRRIFPELKSVIRG